MSGFEGIPQKQTHRQCGEASHGTGCALGLGAGNDKPGPIVGMSVGLPAVSDQRSHELLRLLQRSGHVSGVNSQLLIHRAHELRSTGVLHAPQARHHLLGAALLDDGAQALDFAPVIRPRPAHRRLACRQGHQLEPGEVVRRQRIQHQTGAIAEDEK